MAEEYMEGLPQKRNAEVADEDLLALRVQSGDARAIELLIERHSETACRVAFFILGRHDLAQDAVQDALLNLVTRPRTHWFQGWFVSHVRNAALHLLESERRRASREARAADEQTGEAGMRDQSVTEQDASLEALREELRSLPAESANLLILHHLEGYPIAQLAPPLGISVEACKQRLHRVREALRERLMRRGVRMASLVVLLAGLEELAGASRAWAAEFGDAAGLAAKASLTPGDSRTVPAAELGRAAQKRVQPPGPIPDMRPSAGIVVVAGVLLLLTACLFFGSSPLITKVQEVKDTAGGVSQIPDASRNPLQPLASKLPAGATKRAIWQPPRFFKGLHPLAVGACREHVAVLCSRKEGGTFLLWSEDGGRTFNESSPLPRFYYAAVSADETGRMGIFGTIYSADIKTQYSEWRVLRKGLEIQPPSEVWPPLDSDKEVYFHPRAIGVGGDTWIFALRSGQKRVVAKAFVPMDNKPRLVGETAGFSYAFPAAWARSPEEAGVVVSREKSLYHAHTSDGGHTWFEEEVPMPSGTPLSVGYVSPPLTDAMACTGSTLLLTCTRSFYPDNGKPFAKGYMAISMNLGRSWLEPTSTLYQHPMLEHLGGAVSEPNAMTLVAAHSGPYTPKNDQLSMHSADGPHEVCQTSTNGGQTWMSWSDLTGLGSFSSLHMGGDGQAIHVAFVGWREGEGYLIIRSLTPGEFNRTDVPEWYVVPPESTAQGQAPEF